MGAKVVCCFRLETYSLGSCLVHCLSIHKQVERDLLKSGVIQLLPYRDTAGRRITAVIGNVGTSSHSVKHKVRTA